MAAAAVVLVLAAPARAQVGVNLSAVTDYRYRGASLSDDRPAASLSVTYDHPTGLYAGARLVASQPRGRDLQVMGYMDYAGYAVRPGDSVAIDVGAINYHLTSYRFGERTVDYSEVYAGVVGDHLSAHLYYAPNYHHSGIRTLYAELGGGVRATSRLKLFGHVGVLAPVGGRSGPQTRKERYNLKAGAALYLGAAELNLSWTLLTPPYVPRARGGEPASKVAAGVALFF